MAWARVARWAGIVVGGLVLLVAAVLLGINTAPGRRFVAARISAVESASGLTVKVGRIDGSLYSRMTLVDVAVRDPRGTFLTAPVIQVDWRPFAYVRGKIDVRALLVPRIAIARRPEPKPVPSDPNAPLLPDIDLAVGRLAIDRLELAPPVAGRSAIVRLNGAADIADGRARIDADVATLRGARIAGGDRLTLKLDAVPAENRLLVAVDLRAPTGGLIDSYAGLGRPLSLAVDGRGDWRAWRGAVRATAGGTPVAALDVIGRDGTFRVRGPLTAGVLLTGPAARLVEPRVDVDLTAALAERRVDLRFAARSAAATVTAQGLVDLARSRFENLRLAARLLRPGAIADQLSGRDVAVDAVLDGPTATPTLAYRLSAASLAFGTSGAEGISASGKARVDANRIMIPISAQIRRVTGLNAAAGGLLTNVALDGDLAWSNGRLLSDNLKLRSDRIDATALILADIAKGTYTGALKGRVNDYQVDGLGRINLVTDAELVTGPKGGFGIRGHVRAVTRRLDNASVRDFLGGNAVTTATIGYTEDGLVTIDRLRLSAPLFRVTDGRGSYRLADGRVAFAGHASSSAYGPLAVTVSGTAARPQVLLRAERPGLGVGLRGLEAEVEGTPAGYRVRARGGSDYGPLSADLLIGTGRRLSVDIADARFAGVGARGRLVQVPAGPFAGTLSIGGSGLSGILRLSASGADQRVDADLRAASARIPGEPPITIAGGTIRGSVVLAPSGPVVNGDVLLTGLSRDTLTIQRLQARARWREGQGHVALTAAGSSGVPFDVAAQARLTPSTVLANVRGTANDIAFRLARPARAVKEGGDWRLLPATVVLPQGQVRLAGRYGHRIEAQAQVDGLDLSLAQAFAPGLRLGGKASGTIDYASGGTVPTLNARIAVAGLTRAGIASTSVPLDLSMLASLGDTGADVRAVVRRGATVVGRAQVRLAPLAGGAAPLSQRLLAAPLSGGIRYNGPAELLWSLTGIAGQTLSGPVAVAADFGGRADSPRLTGLVRADTLRYESETYGTTLTGIAVDGRFTQSRLEIARLSAKAGEGGISARGIVGLDAASGFPMDLRATLDRASLARSEALSATVSGDLAVTNSRQAGALIRGTLTIPEARYQIVRQGAAEVPELTGIRRKGAPPAPKVAPSSAPSIWKLDVRVRADNRLFVSGMGLESEWRSDLRVTGTSAAPVVTGDLEVVRGTYSFAGRRFDITRGKVDFRGGALTDPLLDILATTTVGSVTATITIGGRAQNPQITFGSTPALPQDEILSRLLFGGPVTSLSPTQAIQLAAALNSLRGSGGGLNPLGKLRAATGIDRLRILGADDSAGRGTALAAGQYITNDIYVEIITDARGFTATQLEIALSKALSVLSQTGSFGGSNVSVRYRKDY